jgi:hypothetical protein
MLKTSFFPEIKKISAISVILATEELLERMDTSLWKTTGNG